MSKPTDFMKKYGVSGDEIWEVRRGGAWAIKHAALERVAAEQGVVFDRPAILEINLERKVVCICVFGTLGERTEWSVGEASPSNCTNAYPAAMAEKRAKDRVTLKLLNAHGSLYSESEAEEFGNDAPAPRQNPHITRPDDVYPPTQYDGSGHPLDNIPAGDPNIKALPKKDAKAIFSACQTEIRECLSIMELQTWGADNADRIERLPADWKEILRGVYAEHLASLRSAAVKLQQKEVA